MASFFYISFVEDITISHRNTSLDPEWLMKAEPPLRRLNWTSGQTEAFILL
jgi:hypothetical protein